MTDEQRLAERIADEILGLIDEADDMARTDLQGVTLALAKNLIADSKSWPDTTS